MGADSNLRVLEAGVVRPSNLHLPLSSLPLTFFDVKWLRPPPVQRLYLYRLHHHQDTTQLISNLKVSLSKALTLFYPLAGHVRLTPGAPNSNRYELFYKPGNGVSFTVAEYDADIEDLAQDDLVQVAKLTPLVPPLPKGRAVLAVQVTVLLGGQGLALGVTVHHTACDGASSTHFMDTWAAACAGADMPPPPIIDRTLIADTRGLYDIYCKGLPSDDEIEFVGSSVSSIPDDQLLATFTLPQELLHGIKHMLANEAAKQGAPSPRCSSLLAAFSLMWSCYCRAKQEQNQTKTTYFLFSVDHRARLKPPVPDRYLGNCLGPAIAAARHDEIAATGKEGLSAAFMALSYALQEEVGEGSQDRWDGCVERVKEAVKSGVLSVADSPRFHVYNLYNLDFGFGKPAKVDVVSVAKTAAISVEEARRHGGGIEVGISLPTTSLENFQRCFVDAMQDWVYS